MNGKLDKMWERLAAYQAQADRDGHGDSWRAMCLDRTEDAAWRAWRCSPSGHATSAAGWAFWSLASCGDNEDHAQNAIKAIRRAEGAAA